VIVAQLKDRDDEHARGGGGVADDEDDDERWRRGEKRKTKKSVNKTQQNKGTKTRTRVACVRAFFITLSLSQSLNAPHVPRNIPSQGNVRRIPVLAG
jgi:hypothetical protein